MTAMQRTITPVDNSVYVERELATAGQIDHALDAAVRAQRAWQDVPVSERAELCLAMVEALVGKAGDLCAELSWQMGRPIRYTPNEIKGGFNERARHMIAAAEMSLANVEVEPKPGFTRFIRRVPLGVVLTLAPWNYPYLTSVNSIIPAIMAGNTVVLKHSNHTPLCAERYAEAFQAAGFPAGVFQYLHMGHKDVARAVGDDRVNFVAFTGSVPGGHAVTEAAVGRFLGLGLELGGKDPAYVRHDANLAHAIENLVDGAMFNSGQSCCGIERIYVHAGVYDAFVEGFVDLVRQYKLGNPLDPDTTLGPMVRTGAAELVRAQVAEAVGQGATALIDPADFVADVEGTPYLAPQVLVNVDHSMRVMREETFGPVVGIMPVSGDEEAIRLMNDSTYG
ncbi:MAG: short-chain dehydrogenase/reductase, partial [Chloroflexi bacterium]|nr:short-chain dehydrogenase/reductase [Chloroflexota bacterium]